MTPSVYYWYTLSLTHFTCWPTTVMNTSARVSPVLNPYYYMLDAVPAATLLVTTISYLLHANRLDLKSARQITKLV